MLVFWADECSLGGGAGFLRSFSTLVSLVLLFQHLLLHRKEYVLVVTPCWRSLFLRLFPSRWHNCMRIWRPAPRSSKWRIELLVAVLQDVDPYGLYRLGSCSGKEKDVRSVAPIQAFCFSISCDPSRSSLVPDTSSFLFPWWYSSIAIWIYFDSLRLLYIILVSWNNETAKKF